MTVGIVGLGKLGLPVAYAMAWQGLDVYGVDPAVTGPPGDTSHERGLDAAIRGAERRMRFVSLREMVECCETVLVAVQTPHEPRFEGVTPLPEDRADFDYTYLVQAVKHISEEADRQERDLTVGVISTVLPGTMRRHVQPVLSGRVKLCYMPSFIAMGTTIQDFMTPEFVLLGGEDADPIADLFVKLRIRPIFRTSIENAELIKVAYNTFIGLKIAFANTLMEICHKTGCDVDQVTMALKLAHRRLISPAYMDGGMGDGGGCHPRDNIALSWLARELALSHDLFEDVMRCREDQAAWLADLMCEHDLPKGIAGVAYKPQSHITTGSPALLVKRILEDRNHEVAVWDPHVKTPVVMKEPRVWLIGCKHDVFPRYASEFTFGQGSVVIDPFRYIPDQPGITVIRIGEWAPAPTATSASTTPPLAA